MVSIKSKAEISKIREGGQILAEALDLARNKAKPGVVTKDLEAFVVDFLQKKDAEPSFKNFQGYPGSICVCLNEEIVHGIPDKRRIRTGDLVSVDIGVRYKNLYTDAAFTKIVGRGDAEKKKLVSRTEAALARAIEVIKQGATLGDIGAAVQEVAEHNKLGIVRELVGHGVGHRVHEDPQIPNFGNVGEGLVLEEGMVLALEPMLTLGRHEVECLDDGWTFVTKDKSLAAHSEHTVVVTKNGSEILTN